MSNFAEIEALGLEDPQYVPPDEIIPDKTSDNEPVQPATVRVKVVDGKFKDRDTGVESSVRYGKTRAGSLKADIALQIVSGQDKQGNDLTGRWVFNNNLNTTTWSSGDRAGQNSFMNFLAGAYGGPLKTPELHTSRDYDAAVEELLTTGHEFPIRIDFEWYCNPNSTDYTGCGNRMKFASKVAEVNGDGSYNTRLSCNDPSHDDDDAPILKARNFVVSVG